MIQCICYAECIQLPIVYIRHSTLRNVHIIRSMCLVCTISQEGCKFLTLGRLILPNMNLNLVSNTDLNTPT